MAITAYPFENQDTTESQFSAWARELQDIGVVGSFGEASLRVTADSTGMQVKVSAGAAIVRGFYLSSTAVETKTIDAATSQPRIDVVVARLDPAADTITLEVVKGTASATPTAPALTQTDTGIYEMPLAQVTVPASAATIATGNVAEVRPYIGHRVGVWTTTTRPAAPRVGRLGLNRTTSVWEFWTGTAWEALAPVVTWASINGRPATFAPSAHDHALADVTGLVAALAGKSATTHTHTWGSITGRPSVFPPSAHNQDVTSILWGSIQLNTFLDTYFARKTEIGSWVIPFGDNNTARYTRGPDAGAYNRGAGSNYFSVYMDDSLQFARNVSSRRYKSAIAPAVVDIDAVLALEPVTYHRDADTDPTSRDLGLIAEDSTDVDHLVIWDIERDDDGQPIAGAEPRPESVRYETALPVALLAVVKDLAQRVRELEARGA